MYLKINSLGPSSVAAVAPDRQANEQLSLRGLQEVVADKRYHSNDVLTDFTALEIRSQSVNRTAGGANGAASVGNNKRCMATGGRCATAEAVSDNHSPENRRLPNGFVYWINEHTRCLKTKGFWFFINAGVFCEHTILVRICRPWRPALLPGVRIRVQSVR